MGLKGTLFRFVALFALLLALGVVSTSQATVAAAVNLASIQDTEDPDDTEDAVDETTDETDEGTDDVFGDESTPVVEATGTGGGDTTLPDTGSGSGVMSASGGVVAAMLGVFALMMVAAAVITRRRQGASSVN
jgi:hypothetical protein